MAGVPNIPIQLHVEETVFQLPGARVNHPGQGTAYSVTPKVFPAGETLPVLVAVHGSSRGALDYRDTPFYRMQRDIALENGYLFAAVSNGPDTWGLDDGLYNTDLLIDYLTANYPVKKSVALWGSSAGGTLVNRMVMEYPEKVDFILGTFPVYDLLAELDLPSCRQAWKTADMEVFQKLVAGINPAEHPEKLRDHAYYIAHGTADTAVNYTANPVKMCKDVGENVYLETIPGAGHGTGDFSYYGEAVKKAFSCRKGKYTFKLP